MKPCGPPLTQSFNTHVCTPISTPAYIYPIHFLSTPPLCYDQFGCVPVVLSDELLWAYSIETGGFLNATSFSLQLPQKLVQLNAEDALEVRSRC